MADHPRQPPDRDLFPFQAGYLGGVTSMKAVAASGGFSAVGYAQALVAQIPPGSMAGVGQFFLGLGACGSMIIAGLKFAQETAGTRRQLVLAAEENEALRRTVSLRDGEIDSCRRMLKDRDDEIHHLRTATGSPGPTAAARPGGTTP